MCINGNSKVLCGPKDPFIESQGSELPSDFIHFQPFLRQQLCWKSDESHHKDVLFSHSVGSDSLWPHGLQHARLACPSLSPGACSNSCPSSRWCHPAILSYVLPFSSCLKSFPACRLFTSGDQSIGASASASGLSVNIQGWFPLGWTGLISLFSKGLSRVFSSTTVWKHQFFGAWLLNGPTLTSVLNYWKSHSLD